jgi:hypothetical protein
MVLAATGQGARRFYCHGGLTRRLITIDRPHATGCVRSLRWAIAETKKLIDVSNRFQDFDKSFSSTSITKASGLCKDHKQWITRFLTLGSTYQHVFLTRSSIITKEWSTTWLHKSKFRNLAHNPMYQLRGLYDLCHYWTTACFWVVWVKKIKLSGTCFWIVGQVKQAILYVTLKLCAPLLAGRSSASSGIFSVHCWIHSKRLERTKSKPVVFPLIQSRPIGFLPLSFYMLGKKIWKV